MRAPPCPITCNGRKSSHSPGRTCNPPTPSWLMGTFYKVIYIFCNSTGHARKHPSAHLHLRRMHGAQGYWGVRVRTRCTYGACRCARARGRTHRCAYSGRRHVPGAVRHAYGTRRARERRAYGTRMASVWRAYGANTACTRCEHGAQSTLRLSVARAIFAYRARLHNLRCAERARTCGRTRNQACDKHDQLRKQHNQLSTTKTEKTQPILGLRTDTRCADTYGACLNPRASPRLRRLRATHARTRCAVCSHCVHHIMRPRLMHRACNCTLPGVLMPGRSSALPLGFDIVFYKHACACMHMLSNPRTCMCLCTSICLHKRAHAYAYAQTYMCVPMYTRAFACTPGICAHVHRCACPSLHAHTQNLLPTYMCVCAHACTRVQISVVDRTSGIHNPHDSCRSTAIVAIIPPNHKSQVSNTLKYITIINIIM